MQASVSSTQSARYAKMHRSLQAHPLGHRPRRDPRPHVRPRAEVPARRTVAHRPADVSLRRRKRDSCSQVQGRTYANMFGLVERFIGAKMLEVTRTHALGDQTALEALIRFTDEELKHQELFRRIEAHGGVGMPDGYRFVPQPNDVASFVLGKSTWAVLGLTCHIELFSQAHYRQSIEPDAELSPLFKDVFFFHWKEESQHAILDELEWRREDAQAHRAEARDRAVDDLIALVAGIDAMLQEQAAADAHYFVEIAGRPFGSAEVAAIRETMLGAYRWQYIVSGVGEPRFASAPGRAHYAPRRASALRRRSRRCSPHNGAAMLASRIPVPLQRNQLLRILHGRGTRVTSRSGMLWLSEEGSSTTVCCCGAIPSRSDTQASRWCSRYILRASSWRCPTGVPPPRALEVALADGQPGRRIGLEAPGSAPGGRPGGRRCGLCPALARCTLFAAAASALPVSQARVRDGVRLPQARRGGLTSQGPRKPRARASENVVSSKAAGRHCTRAGLPCAIANGCPAMAAAKQEIRFCTSHDGVRIAYARSGHGPPLVKVANWLSHLEFDWESPVWRPLAHRALARPHADPL